MHTSEAVDEPFLSVLVEEMGAEDELQALVAGLASARCQHLIQQCHLLVANSADAG